MGPERLGKRFIRSLRWPCRKTVCANGHRPRLDDECLNRGSGIAISNIVLLSITKMLIVFTDIPAYLSS